MTENQKLHKQYAFEDFMKTVLRNKARNIHKKLDIQEQRETAASNYDESIFDNLMTEDSYALETMIPFCVKEQIFVVTPHIGNALSYLQPKYRDVLLLSYFAEWSDSKIARYLNLPVSTVNSRRNQALQQAQADHGARQGCRNFYLMKRFAKLSTVIHRAFAPSWSILRDISIGFPCGRARISMENRAPT